MEVRIKDSNGYIDADWTIEDGVMVVSPKVVKFEPKDGDIVAINEGTQIFVCKKYLRDGVIHAYFGWDFTNNVIFDEGEWGVERPATFEEMKKFFDKLKENGLAWDAEKRELVKLKWKPADREKVYVAGFTFYGEHPFCPFEDAAYADSMQWRAVYKRGWYFKTIEECQSFCDKLNQAIDSVKL